jgi:hypothetical protein
MRNALSNCCWPIGRRFSPPLAKIGKAIAGDGVARYSELACPKLAASTVNRRIAAAATLFELA